MDSLRKILESKIFLAVFHLIIFGIIITNIVYIEQIHYCEVANKQLTSESESLKQQLDNLENKEAYENSNFFENKKLRERNYKLKGEDVIDTAPIEPLPEKPDEMYIPEAKLEYSNNFDAWIGLFKPKAVVNQSLVKCGNV